LQDAPWGADVPTPHLDAETSAEALLDALEAEAQEEDTA
jgi:hypothetical protein